MHLIPKLFFAYVCGILSILWLLNQSNTNLLYTTHNKIKTKKNVKNKQNFNHEYYKRLSSRENNFVLHKVSHL